MGARWSTPYHQRFEPVKKLTLIRISETELHCLTLDNQLQRFMVVNTVTGATAGTARQIFRLTCAESGLVAHIERHFPDSDHAPEVLAHYPHDDQRDLITHTDARDNTRTYQYLLTFYSNRNGLGCYLDWDWPGKEKGAPAKAQEARCIHNWLDDGSEDTRFEYNRGLWYTKVIDAEGLITYYRYNYDNRIKSRTHPYQPSLGSEHWRWDEHGNLIAHFDGEGRATAMEYDVQGRLTKVTDPMSRTTVYAYDDQGRLTQVTDPLGRTEPTRYDEHNRVVEEIDFAGRATQITYDELGLPIVIRYPDDTTEQFAYDGEGDLIRYTNPKGEVNRYAYDGKGLPVERIDAAGFRLAYHYNRLRRLNCPTN